MKSTMLAIATMAFATLAPLAMAAEGQGDNAEKQPTMAELKAKMNGISTEIAALAATVGNLATATVGTASTSLASKVDALAATVTANHTIIVGRFAPQMAVVMSVQTWWSGWNGRASELMSGDSPRFHLVGESTIPGFPAGTVGADGRLTDTTLPAGTYLFELQQPYGDNAICQSELSRRHIAGTSARYRAACPSVRFRPFRNRTRLEDSYGIYTYTAPTAFDTRHSWPAGLKFAEDTSLSATERAGASSIASYTGAVRITKLK